MITVSEKAKNRIAQLMGEQKYDDSYFLRIGVESGGCSGLSYKLDFDNQKKPETKFLMTTKLSL
jgi:iron-sulfur cluster assembly protein